MNYKRQFPSNFLDLCPIIDQKYKVLFKLGCGRFSKVKMAINLATNERVAIKIMNQKIEINQFERQNAYRTLQIFLNQISMILQAKHRNIVEIIDFNIDGVSKSFDGKTKRILYYVMKIEEYGQMFRIINLTDQFSQKSARRIFSQLLSALNLIHAKKIAHCDIKSQNILLDANFNIKLVDFGSARYHADKSCEQMQFNDCQTLGSLKSNPPQLSNLVKNGTKVYCKIQNIDVFAAGCFLFQLVMKTSPFKSSKTTDQCYSKLVKNQTNKFWSIFSTKYVPSPQFKDLIQKMLAYDPNERICFEEIRKHPWLKGQTINRTQYKKQMNTRVKKVTVRLRKQHEIQMKQIFLKEKGKNETKDCSSFSFKINEKMMARIHILKGLILNPQKQSSDTSSLEDSQNEIKPDRCKQDAKVQANPQQKDKLYQQA